MQCLNVVGQQGLRIAHPVLLCHLCLHLHTSGTSANSYSGPPIRPLGDKCQQSRRLQDNGLGRRPTQGPAGARGLWSSVSVCSGCANRIPWTEWLGHRHLFLILLKAVKSKIHVPADSVASPSKPITVARATQLSHWSAWVLSPPLNHIPMTPTQQVDRSGLLKGPKEAWRPGFGTRQSLLLQTIRDSAFRC